MRTQSIDTHIKTEQVIISLLRGKSIAHKFSIIRSLSQSTIQLSKRAIARANRGINDDQVDLIFIEIHYGKEIARRFEKYVSEKHDNT
jgi:hypothetical protein